MNKLHIAFLAAFALVAAPALSGCETATEIPTDESNPTATVVDADSVGMDTDLDADSLGADSLGASLDEAGDAIEGAAAAAGAAVKDGAAAVGDVVDENVDLGENAENQ